VTDLGPCQYVGCAGAGDCKVTISFMYQTVQHSILCEQHAGLVYGIFAKEFACGGGAGLPFSVMTEWP